jgi:hypothetical protein
MISIHSNAQSLRGVFIYSLKPFLISPTRPLMCAFQFASDYAREDFLHFWHFDFELQYPMGFNQ